MSIAVSKRCALTIAGSDSGGGAGIQADLKTFAAHGVHGLCAIAALTAQNTQAVTAVHVPPAEFLRAQLEALAADFEIAAIKIGMLGSREVIETVAAFLAQLPGAQVVLDPVMIASSGARLLAESALSALGALIPHATLLTPNIPEAELLLGHAIANGVDAESALHELRALGARAVLLKGGHLREDRVRDRLLDAEGVVTFEHARMELEAHGTGCTLASAIAAELVRGAPLRDACRLSADYVHGALRAAYHPGRAPLAVLDHHWALSGSASFAPWIIKPEMAP